MANGEWLRNQRSHRHGVRKRSSGWVSTLLRCRKRSGYADTGLLLLPNCSLRHASEVCRGSPAGRWPCDRSQCFISDYDHRTRRRILRPCRASQFWRQRVRNLFCSRQLCRV